MSLRSRNSGRVVGSSPFGAVHPLAMAGVEPMRRATRHVEEESAPARVVRYTCPAGHDLPLTLAATAAVPPVWECAVHRVDAELTDDTVAADLLADAQPGPRVHVPKTHWEHVLERRTIADLEALLQERLELLRSRRGERAVGDAA